MAAAFALVRRDISTSIDTDRPKLTKAQEYDLENYSYDDIIDHFIRRSIRVMELGTAKGSLGLWVEEANRNKVRKCLHEPKFVRKATQKLLKESSCEQLLVEFLKLMVSTDHSAASQRAAKGPSSLEIFLGCAIIPYRPPEVEGLKTVTPDLRQMTLHFMRFVLQELDEIGTGHSPFPHYMHENIMFVFTRLWKFVRDDTFPLDELKALVDSLQELLSAWFRTPTEKLQLTHHTVRPSLTVIQSLLKRCLQLKPDIINWAKYAEVRDLLRKLDHRLKIWKGQWMHIMVDNVQSSLPAPPLAETDMGALNTDTLCNSKVMQQITWKKPKESLRRSSPSPMLAGARIAFVPQNDVRASICGHLDGWVKTGDGRMRPWSANLGEVYKSPAVAPPSSPSKPSSHLRPSSAPDGESPSRASASSPQRSRRLSSHIRSVQALSSASATAAGRSSPVKENLRYHQDHSHRHSRDHAPKQIGSVRSSAVFQSTRSSMGNFTSTRSSVHSGQIGRSSRASSHFASARSSAHLAPEQFSMAVDSGPKNQSSIARNRISIHRKILEDPRTSTRISQLFASIDGDVLPEEEKVAKPKVKMLWEKSDGTEPSWEENRENGRQVETTDVTTKSRRDSDKSMVRFKVDEDMSPLKQRRGSQNGRWMKGSPTKQRKANSSPSRERPKDQGGPDQIEKEEPKVVKRREYSNKSDKSDEHVENRQQSRERKIRENKAACVIQLQYREFVKAKRSSFTKVVSEEDQDYQDRRRRELIEKYEDFQSNLEELRSLLPPPSPRRFKTPGDVTPPEVVYEAVKPRNRFSKIEAISNLLAVASENEVVVEDSLSEDAQKEEELRKQAEVDELLKRFDVRRYP